MWKIIILSAFLSVCQAAKTSDIYGTYTRVVGVKGSLVFSHHQCMKLSIAEDPRKIQCTCSDGINSTLVEMRLLETLPQQQYGSDVLSMPMIVVGPDTKLNDAAVVSLYNVTCDCAGKEFRNREVVKVVNKDYAQAYVSIRYTPEIKTDYVLLSRNLLSAAELRADITLIDPEKATNGPVLCTQEIYEGLRPKN